MSINLKKLNSSHLATIGGFIAILLWSSTFAVVRHLSENIGAVTAAASIYGIGGLFTFIPLLRERKKLFHIIRLPMKYLAGCGLLFLANMVCLFFAIGYSASREQLLEVGLVNYIWPTLTLTLSLIILKERANWILLPGTLLSIAGLFLVVTQGGSVSWDSFRRNFAGNPFAYSMALGAAVSWALYSNLTRKFLDGEKEGGVALFLPVTALVFLMISFFIEEPHNWTIRVVIEALVLGIGTYYSYMLWDNAMRKGNVPAVAVASYMTPMFSTLISCFYLAVVPGAKIILGCGFLILGSIMSWLSIIIASRRKTDIELSSVIPD